MTSGADEIRGDRDESQRMSIGTILFGLILLMLGSLWLLDVAEIINVTWTLVGSGILVLLGILLIASSNHGPHGGMVFLGVVLSVIVLLGSLASWPSFQGGVGDRSFAPADVTEIEESYRWSVGSQEVDLREVEFPAGETKIQVQLGTGDLTVRLPDDASYQIDWSVGLGDAQVMDQNRSGISLNDVYHSDDFDDAEVRVVLEVRLGIGSLEVRQ